MYDDKQNAKWKQNPVHSELTESHRIKERIRMLLTKKSQKG